MFLVELTARLILGSVSLLIWHGEVLTPVQPDPAEGFESIHISTSSMRTDFKHNLAGSIVELETQRLFVKLRMESLTQRSDLTPEDIEVATMVLSKSVTESLVHRH